MRTIKFRGKEIETEKWVYGYYVRLEDPSRKPVKGIERVTHRIYTGMADTCVVPNGYDFSPSWYEVVPDSVGQFTGLYDKNGKEIYEEDIIDFTNVDYPDCEIIFDNGSFVCNEIGEDNIICELRLSLVNEVIGNIHDNLEMFEGGDK